MAHNQYSDVYSDDVYDYRHVIMNLETRKKVAELVVVGQTYMTEAQWRSAGVHQSKRWEHYSWHGPEPELLLFRRLKNAANNNNKLTPQKDKEDPSEPERPQKPQTTKKKKSTDIESSLKKLEYMRLFK
jgi:cyclin-dependent kinase regulatory subunit CKS1